METTVTIAMASAASAAVAVSAILLTRQKKKKPQYSVKNVVWWIDSHISTKMMTKKPQVIDKIYGQYVYLNLPIQNVTLKIDKLMKRVKTTSIDNDFLTRLSFVFVSKQYVGKPFVFFGIIRNSYLPKKRKKRVTILPEIDSPIYENIDVISKLDTDISKPLTIPPFYFYCKVTDSLSYFIIFVNRNAVRLFGTAQA